MDDSVNPLQAHITAAGQAGRLLNINPEDTVNMKTEYVK